MNSMCLYNKRDEESFKTLFLIESYIRLIVRWELKGNFGLDWKGIVPEEITKECITRRNIEIENGCVDAFKDNYFSYMNLSELKDILTKRDLWDGSFKNNWGAKDIVLADFKRLISIRNKMAHFRSLTERDVRLIRRFIEDLDYRTSNYDSIRRFTNRIYNMNYEEIPSVLNKNEYIINAVSLIKEHNGFNDLNAEIYSLSNHWGVQLALQAGSIDSRDFIKFADDHASVISVCRIGSLGDKVEVQFSKKIPSDKSINLIKNLIHICLNPVEGVSSDESLDNYKINMREEVLPWGMNFPCSFKINEILY